MEMHMNAGRDREWTPKKEKHAKIYRKYTQRERERTTTDEARSNRKMEKNECELTKNIFMTFSNFMYSQNIFVVLFASCSVSPFNSLEIVIVLFLCWYLDEYLCCLFSNVSVGLFLYKFPWISRTTKKKCSFDFNFLLP